MPSKNSTITGTADDFEFLRPDGSAVRLSQLRRGPLVLIFLRHLA